MSDIVERLTVLYNNRDHDGVLEVALAEIERLRANSERYEWLKNRIHLSLDTHITEFRQPDGSLLRRPYRLIANEILFDPRETLDATIDTAMALEANNFMDPSHD